MFLANIKIVSSTVSGVVLVLVKRRAGDLYPILKLERNARVISHGQK